MNPLFQMMNKPNGNIMQILQQFQQFKQNFKGNPQEMIQQMLNSGRISQQQYNSAVQMAQQLQNFIR
jgi:hypothetical protein